MKNITDTDAEAATIDDLRPLVAEIKKFWMMGDHQIITEAQRALLRVLHDSAKPFRK